MSLDGYVAKDDNTIGRLFDWYQNGELEFPTAPEGITFHLSPQRAGLNEVQVSFERRAIARYGEAHAARDAHPRADRLGG